MAARDITDKRDNMTVSETNSQLADELDGQLTLVTVTSIERVAGMPRGKWVVQDATPPTPAPTPADFEEPDKKDSMKTPEKNGQLSDALDGWLNRKKILRIDRADGVPRGRWLIKT